MTIKNPEKKTPREWAREWLSRADDAGAEASASEVVEVIVTEAVAYERDQLALVQKQNADNLKMRGEYMKERDISRLQVDELRKILDEVWITHDEIVVAVKPILPPETVKLWQEACQKMRSQPPVIEKMLDLPKNFTGCKVCGAKQVMIRGKFPGQPDREVCPTCATEKLEDFLERQSPDYGKAVQNPQAPKGLEEKK